MYYLLLFIEPGNSASHAQKKIQPVLHYTMKYSRNDPNELMDFLIGYEDLCFSTVV